MIRMPEKSYRGAIPALDDTGRILSGSLKRDVEELAGKIGERNVFHYPKLVEAAEFIRESFAESGYAVQRQDYEIGARTCWNLEAAIPGSKNIIVVGAHYDSVAGSPGANDNATGVAAMLALAREFAGEQTACTLRFVAFVNEEPPFFMTPEMGSVVYARRCRSHGEKVVAMMSLETVGCFSDEAGSQRYPLPFGLFYPSEGNFIAFVGNMVSRALVREVIASFRSHARFPSEGAALPAMVPGVSWSDHWSFWKQGYPALMVTDTAPFRYPQYHESEDTPDKVDCDKLAHIVIGLKHVIEDLDALRSEKGISQ